MHKFDDSMSPRHVYVDFLRLYMYSDVFRDECFIEILFEQPKIIFIYRL